ncbi:DUF6801 domain-containing protein [Amycolatopsis cihanbeyliensis]|uniref:DUF6801 domain-containing protein n=1 Tax=Amycolatopsis cihanbeyliensis TaxID=1128664 RepID=A0A542DMB1_AMYCI|nr:DUF6801 domain-containing protein [Amycolatopsis cihanbeyliensis]TQJ04230.1 hypothetical protein FB471_4013 [Amycolatopsis cihanbeyliensis]
MLSVRSVWRGRIRGVAIAAVAALTLVAGPVAAGSAPETGDAVLQPVTTSLRNTCEFPAAGTQPLTAGVTASFPTVVEAPRELPAAEVSVGLVFPAETVTALRAAGRDSLAGTVRVNVFAQHAGKRARVQAKAELPAQPLPAEGELAVRAPGELEPIATSVAGEVALTLDRAELILLGEAEGAESPAGVFCTLEEGQDAALGTVRVAAADRTPTPTPTTERTSPAAESSTPSTPSPRSTTAAPEASQPARRAPEGPPGAAADTANLCGTEIPEDAIQVRRGYYDVVVTAGVTKLDSDIVFGPPGYLGGDLWLWLRSNPDTGGILYCNGIKGDLWLPETRDSFVIFRFVPTSALVKVTQTAPAEGSVDPLEFVFQGTATAMMTMRDVQVNGTPLDVGPNCGTSVPIEIELSSEPGEWDLANGGVMESEYSIPEFANCGTKEPLDSLFTNLVSGPGNHIRIEFSPIRECSVPDPPPVCAQGEEG